MILPIPDGSLHDVPVILHALIVSLSAQVVVVNMLAGPMRRLMPILVLAVKPGGFLCLSGLRPSDVPDIKR